MDTSVDAARWMLFKFRKQEKRRRYVRVLIDQSCIYCDRELYQLGSVQSTVYRMGNSSIANGPLDRLNFRRPLDVRLKSALCLGGREQRRILLE